MTSSRILPILLVLVLTACGQPPPTPRVCGKTPSMGAVPAWTLNGAPSELRVASPLSECAASPPVHGAEAEVWAEDGTAVAVQVTGVETTADGFSIATVAVPALPPGRYLWSVNFSPSLGTSSGDFYVVDDRPAATALDESYVDTMEFCWPPPVRSTAGATFCTRDSEVWVYRAGQIEGHFPGVGLSVHGDAVWSAVNDQLERRTDTGAALRVDGRVTMDWGTASNWGETSATRAVRGSPKGATVVSWDGGTLAASDVDVDPSYAFAGILAVDDGTPWLATYGLGGPCRIERGCQQTTCPPVFECYPEPTSSVPMSLEPGGYFRLETRAGSPRVELAWYPRPFDLATARASRGAAPPSTRTWDTNLLPDQVAPAFLQGDGSVLVARGAGERFVLERYQLRGADFLWATEDFVVAKLGPRQLRFISRR